MPLLPPSLSALDRRRERRERRARKANPGGSYVPTLPVSPSSSPSPGLPLPSVKRTRHGLALGRNEPETEGEDEDPEMANPEQVSLILGRMQDSLKKLGTNRPPRAPTGRNGKKPRAKAAPKPTPVAVSRPGSAAGERESCPVCYADLPKLRQKVSPYLQGRKCQPQSPRPETLVVQPDGCEHKFCGKCIFDWAKRGDGCPMCRAEFKELRALAEDGYDAFVVGPCFRVKLRSVRHVDSHPTQANGTLPPLVGRFRPGSADRPGSAAFSDIGSEEGEVGAFMDRDAVKKRSAAIVGNPVRGLRI